MYTVCDVQDGDYILVDVSRRQGGRYPIIDGYVIPDTLRSIFARGT